MPRTIAESFWDIDQQPWPWMVRGTVLQVQKNEQEKCQEQSLRIKERIRQQRKNVTGGNLLGLKPTGISSETSGNDSQTNVEKREFCLTGYDVLRHRRKLKELHDLTVGRISTDTRDAFEHSTVTSGDYISLGYANTWNNRPSYKNTKQRVSKKELAKREKEKRRASLERLQNSVFQNTGLVLPKIDLIDRFTAGNEIENNNKRRRSRSELFPRIGHNRSIKENLKFADACDLGELRVRLNDAMNTAKSRRGGSKKRGSTTYNRIGKRSSSVTPTANKLPILTEEVSERKEINTNQNEQKKIEKKRKGKEKMVMSCAVKDLALPVAKEIEEYKPSYSRNLNSIYRYSCLPPLY